MGRAIQYTGLSHVREISKADWKQAGVEDAEKMVWDVSNGWRFTPEKDLTDEQVEIFEADPEFSFVDEDAPPVRTGYQPDTGSPDATALTQPKKKRPARPQVEDEK